MSTTLSPRERITVSISREIARTNHYGKPFCTPLSAPLVFEITDIEPHECHGDKWVTNACVVCWGNQVVVKSIYDTDGHETDFGGRFDEAADRWIWSCYAD